MRLNESRAWYRIVGRTGPPHGRRHVVVSVVKMRGLKEKETE